MFFFVVIVVHVMRVVNFLRWPRPSRIAFPGHVKRTTGLTLANVSSANQKSLSNFNKITCPNYNFRRAHDPSPERGLSITRQGQNTRHPSLRNIQTSESSHVKSAPASTQWPQGQSELRAIAPLGGTPVCRLGSAAERRPFSRPR